MNHSPDPYRIHKDTPVPLYFQLKQNIQQLIGSGSLQTGDMLPTEKELCERLSVSRPTVRQALNELVVEGLLVRKKGKGTQVAPPKVAGLFFQQLESFNAEMSQKGLVPTTKVLALKKIPATEQANARLQLAQTDALIQLTRLRFANGEPVVYLDTYLPHALFADILGQNFEEHSLYERMAELHGIRVQRVQREIEAVNATHRQAEWFGVKTGKALCRVETIACAESGHPVEYSVAYYLGDRNKFSVELYR